MNNDLLIVGAIAAFFILRAKKTPVGDVIVAVKPMTLDEAKSDFAASRQYAATMGMNVTSSQITQHFLARGMTAKEIWLIDNSKDDAELVRVLNKASAIFWATEPQPGSVLYGMGK